MPITASRIKAIWPWLAEARPAWLCVAVIVIALIISFFVFPTECGIRITGLVLQLFGIGTVTLGIIKTRALFGHPSFASKIKAWLSKFPLLHQHYVLSVNSASHAMGTGKATIHQIHKAADSTIEARLDSLEKNMTLIHERITQTQKDMDEGLHKIGDSVKREERLRQSEDNEIRKKLEATGTGGVNISLIGAFWLFLGLILSTAAPEIATLFK